MPSLQITYFPGSGFIPLIASGTLFSGTGIQTGIQARADHNNSGTLWITYSGSLVLSGGTIISLLVTSGGGTINSGGQSNCLSGMNDAMPLYPSDSIFIPLKDIQAVGQNSGFYTIGVASDAACSGGFGRIYWLPT